MIKVYDLSTDKTTLYSTINSRAEGSCHNLQQEKILFCLQAGFSRLEEPKSPYTRQQTAPQESNSSGFVKLESDKKKPSCFKNNNSNN